MGVVYGQSLIRRGAGERLYRRGEAGAFPGWVFPAMLMDKQFDLLRQFA